MRRRIVILTVLSAVLAISLFGIPLAAGVARYYTADERSELTRFATEATVTVSAGRLNGHDPTELPRTEPGVELGVYDVAGRRVSGHGPATADAAVRAALRGVPAEGHAGSDIVVTVPLAQNERVTGVIRASAGTRFVYRRITRTWLLMLAVACAAVVITALLARRQARRLARPLEEMSVLAGRLGDGDFSVRSRPSGIPEIDSTGASLSTTAERLGALLSRERAFSADASHQLRTPLTGLRLRLESMLDPPRGPRDDGIAQAMAEVDRLQRTIDDLLTLARDAPRHQEPLDLDGLLEEVRETWHADLAAQGRPLRIRVAPDLPATHASTAAARQILGVLLTNAAGHGRGTVTVNVRDAGDALAIDVIDQGPGIDRRADELFHRRAAATGHGIGLAMAKSLAEAEGGRLRLSSPSPPTFTLLLPGV
ncbi:MAG TPA: HAMP domain-containing sensor histidine kinase [Actinoallomurus sp.]